MMGYTRKWMLIGLSLCLLVPLSLAGCGAGGDGNAANGQVEINLWGGYSELDPWYKTMVDGYRKDHPNVTIKVSSFPLREFEKKVATSLPSNSAADIISINPDIALRYIQSNLIQKAPDDLATFVNSGAYPEIMSKTAAHEGAVYGIPHLVSRAVIFWNKKMFEEANLAGPPTQIEEYVDYARKLAKYDANGKLTRAGMSLRLSGGGSGVAEKFWVLMAQHGGSIVKEVSPGKYKANYDNEAGLKTLQMYVDMVHKYKTDDPTLKHDTEAFESEVAAFFSRESWVIGDIAKKAPSLDYDTAPMPSANVVITRNFYVTSSAKGDKANVAWDFVRYMMKPENHKQMIESSGWMPAREDLDLEDLFTRYPQYRSFMTEQTLDTYPAIPEFDEILTKFADRLANQGFTDPSFVDNPDKMKAFLAAAAKESNDILKKNGHLAE